MGSAEQCDTTECRKIRVLVVDEHQAVRHAIATLVSALDDMELTGEAASVDAALALCAAPPDVALLALSFRGMTAAAACQAIRERWPSVRVVGMSTFQEENQAQTVLEAGAVGYLLKNVSGEELAGAIRRAFDPLLLASLPGRVLGACPSSTQKEVLAHPRTNQDATTESERIRLGRTRNHEEIP